MENHNSASRRKFLQKLAATSLATVAAPLAALSGSLPYLFLNHLQIPKIPFCTHINP